jgi:hypothetical protein
MDDSTASSDDGQELSPLGAAAMKYATEYGWAVLPTYSITTEGACTCGATMCGSAGKHPRTRFGVKDATTDAGTISKWWTEDPHANVAIAMGSVSRLIGLDIDPRHNGDDTLKQLEQEYGPLPCTVEAISGSGGAHFYFRYPDNGIVIPNSAGKVGPGLDVKADNGYLIASPSRHATGREYAWEVEHDPDDVPLAGLPTPWLDLLSKTPATIQTDKDADEAGPRIADGRRNDTLTSLAGTMRRRGMTQAEILAALLRVNADRCIPPLDQAEVKRLVTSVARYRPVPMQQLAHDLPTFPTDVLPEPLKQFVTEGSAHFPCPPDFLAIPLLVLLGGVFGKSRVLQVKPGWKESSRLWWAIVGEPGTMKSPALRQVSTWIEQMQKEAIQEWLQEKTEHEQALHRFKVDLQKWELDAKKQSGPQSPAPVKPPPPRCRRFIVDDITIEALAARLRDNPRGLTLLTDELAGWAQGIGQYKKQGGSDRKRYLSLWAGQTLIVDRAIGDPVFIADPFLSVIGGIQPDALRDLNPEAGMRDGFIHRLLLCEPPQVPIRYSDAVFTPSNLDKVGNLFKALHELKPELDDREAHMCSPQALSFTDRGKAQWAEWYDAHCAESVQNDFPAVLHGPWAKLRGYSVSISLILALAESPDATVVEEQAVLGAATLLDEYIKPHLRRLYPKMLAKNTTPFERCRAAVLKALEHPLPYRALRQKVGGRYPGDLVRHVLADLQDSGQIDQRKGLSGELEYSLTLSHEVAE